MKNGLKWTELELLCGELNKESCLPDILSEFNVQNRTKFDLEKDDEIYAGYGQRKTAYPYRQQDCYNRALTSKKIKAAVLENRWMRAEFLPEYGGRLWRLFDKKHQRELLYTNDCLRASNLAIRNAWFSGGVEWNCGVIGHTPFTMDRIFAAELKQNNLSVLRMYAFERIRKIVYQMDFWLSETEPALECHFTLYNQNEFQVPMYWWTNIASSLYENGRLFVQSQKAYSHFGGVVKKVDIPCPQKGMDVSHYATLPIQQDFFFELEKDAPRWIANVDSEGVGLLHTSTKRLQSRKLFVWGNTEGADRWQEFLTNKAGKYLEIQAGIGKTQYGCIPMPANTVWSWTERFEMAKISKQTMQKTFEQVGAEIGSWLQTRNVLEQAEAFGEKIRQQIAKTVCFGTGEAALENKIRKYQNKPLLVGHLDFASNDKRGQMWDNCLKNNAFVCNEPFFEMDMEDVFWIEFLQRHPNLQSWQYFTAMSLLANAQDDLLKAEWLLEQSILLKATALNCYIKAVYKLKNNDFEQAAEWMEQGIKLCDNQLDYVKAGLKLFDMAQSWEKMLKAINGFSKEIQQNSRVQFCKAKALHKLGKNQQALDILQQGNGLEVEDIRECDQTIGRLWRGIIKELTGEYPDRVPQWFNFNSMDIKEENTI